MTENTQPQANYDFDAYCIKERLNPEPKWTRIGVAFNNRKSEGITVKLDALPLGGTIVLMPPKPKSANTESESAH